MCARAHRVAAATRPAAAKSTTPDPEAEVYRTQNQGSAGNAAEATSKMSSVPMQKSKPNTVADPCPLVATHRWLEPKWPIGIGSVTAKPEVP